MAHLRHIAAEGAYNVRDLGGYPTSEGYSADWNKLYQSDALNYLTETGWGNLHAAEVRTVTVDRLDEGAVLLFCSTGKDRTGIIAALALTLAGVPHDDIVVDNMSSAVYNHSGFNKGIAMGDIDRTPDGLS